jgi:hypothetical protein
MRRPIAALVVLVMTAAACGGSAGSGNGVASLDDTATAPPETVASLDSEPEEPVSDEEALLAFAACLRSHGIDVEDPTVDAEGNVRLGALRGGGPDGGADRETMQAAFAACGDRLQGVALGFRGQGIDETERQDALLAYAACMRDNGFDMPDPDLDFTPGDPGEGPRGGSTFVGPFGEIDPNDPQFVAAQEACAEFLAGFGPGRGPGGGPGGG